MGETCRYLVVGLQEVPRIACCRFVLHRKETGLPRAEIQLPFNGAVEEQNPRFALFFCVI